MRVGIDGECGDVVRDAVHHPRQLLSGTSINGISSSSTIQPRIMVIQLNNSIRFGERMTQCQVTHMTGAFGSQEEKGGHGEQDSDEENRAEVDEWAAILVVRSGFILRPTTSNGWHCIHAASHGFG